MVCMSETLVSYRKMQGVTQHLLPGAKRREFEGMIQSITFVISSSQQPQPIQQPIQQPYVKRNGELLNMWPHLHGLDVETDAKSSGVALSGVLGLGAAQTSKVLRSSTLES